MEKEQQPDFIDLTAFYGKPISEDDVWKNINAIAGKELLQTGEDGIFFAIADTLKQKDHVIRGGGQSSKRQQINRSIYLSDIQEISKKAKYVGTENNSDFRNKKKKGIVAFHYFESTVKINENFYKVKFAAAEYTQYEIERLKKIGKLPLSTVSSETSNLQNIWLSSPNEHSISHGKKMSSKVPGILYLYNIKEQALGRNYLNQIKQQNTIQKETHNMKNTTKLNKNYVEIDETNITQDFLTEMKEKNNPMSVMQIRNSSISDETSSFPESRQLTPDSRADKSITLNKKNSQCQALFRNKIIFIKSVKGLLVEII